MKSGMINNPRDCFDTTPIERIEQHTANREVSRSSRLIIFDVVQMSDSAAANDHQVVMLIKIINPFDASQRQQFQRLATQSAPTAVDR